MGILYGNLESEVQNSAKATLHSISKAFGAEDVSFEFEPQGKLDLDVGVADKVLAGQGPGKDSEGS